LRWYLARLILQLEDGGDSPSETLVDLQKTTRHYIPEGSTLLDLGCENLKFYICTEYVCYEDEDDDDDEEDDDDDDDDDEVIIVTVVVLIHKLINYNSICNKEELPNQLKEQIIVPIHRKGYKTDCSNYRGISLLSTSYRIFFKVKSIYR
jgi:hypothetical protein